jgi:hypothetical protein
LKPNWDEDKEEEGAAKEREMARRERERAEAYREHLCTRLLNLGIHRIY